MSGIAKYEQSIAGDLEAIQQPRTGFQLQRMVVGQHDTAGQQWAQCILEMQLKIHAVKSARIDQQIAEEKIAKLERRGKRIAKLKAEKIRLDLEHQRLAEIGALRELACLEAIRQSFGRSWTREELESEQAEYWQRRLLRQASEDMVAYGRVGVGNQEALRQIGISTPGGAGYIQEVEQRFLETGKVRILISVPTLIPRDVIERESLRCLDGWEIPATIERRLYVVQGKAIDAAYNDAAQTALQDGADFLLTVEDDHVIPPGSFDRIWSVYQQHGPRAIVGAWYPQRKDPRAGAAIVVRGGKREYLGDDGSIHDVYTIPQGFTLIPTSIFRELPHPWFATTGSLTQDSFFSQLAREAGYKLLVDTSCRIGHVDRETGRVYQ